MANNDKIQCGVYETLEQYQKDMNHFFFDKQMRIEVISSNFNSKPDKDHPLLVFYKLHKES